MEEEDGWSTVGGRGGVRRRNPSGSPQGGGSPPGKKVDDKASPGSRPKNSPLMTSPNKFDILGLEEVDGEEGEESIMTGMTGKEGGVPEVQGHSS